MFQNASHFKVYHRRNDPMVNETQKVAQQQQTKLYQCKKDPHEQLQVTHKNALHITYLGNQ